MLFINTKQSHRLFQRFLTLKLVKVGQFCAPCEKAILIMVIIMHKTLSNVLSDNINNKHIISFYVCNSARNTLDFSASKWEQKQTEKQNNNKRPTKINAIGRFMHKLDLAHNMQSSLYIKQSIFYYNRRGGIFNRK